MHQAGSYRVTITDKDTGEIVAVYPVITDGTTPPDHLALESSVIDGRYETIEEASTRAVCSITTLKP